MVREVTRAVIWARASGRCQYPGCNQSLIGDLISGNEDANFGFIAHIVAEKPTGPRGHPTRSPSLADDPANLMLLCHKHHKLIDVDELDKHPEQRLLDMKAAHERRIEILTAISEDRASHVLRYGAKIGLRESPVSFDRVRQAMLPERYPADGRSIAIEILGSVVDDGEDRFWQLEPDNLRRQFEALVRAPIGYREISHVSVFALAPIPLLFELGRLLGDILPMDIYQLHREPSSWRWANDSSRVTFSVRRPIKPQGPIALKLSISALIADDRVTSILGDHVAIWEINASGANNDIMRSPEDLREFRRLARSIYSEIRVAHGAGPVHVFAAVPVSVAVEAGRVWMPKAHLPLRIYDETPNRGFVERLRVE